MAGLEGLEYEDIPGLANIPLKRLRRNATNLHAVCRYKDGTDKRDPNLGVNDVREVGIHPNVLTEEWIRYAEFLLYHEFLHALGYVAHNRQFRELESLWPDKEAPSMSKYFSEHLRKRNAKFVWTCPKCDWKTYRTVRASGRYLCRQCRVQLIDIEYSQSSE
tara:strand:- start:43 stop:528 length:486 start_codon:yes stop_codon:yes gene_type:complete